MQFQLSAILLSILLCLLILAPGIVNANTTSSVIESPNGNSTPLQCVPDLGTNYARVNEYPTPDDGSSYVSMDGVNSLCEDNYTLANPNIPSGATINNVTVSDRCEAVGAGTGTHVSQPTLTVDNIKYVGTSSSTPTSWTTYSSTFTNSSWTSAMFGSIYVGIKLSVNNINNWLVEMTQEFVNITYTSAGAPPSWHSIKIWDQLDTRQWFSIGLYEILNTRAWNSVSWFEQLFTFQWHSIVWQMILLVRDNSWDLGGALVGALIFFPMIIIGIAYIRRKK